MEKKESWIKFRRKIPLIIGVIGVLINVIYICIYQNVDKYCVLSGIVSVLIIAVGRYVNQMSISEELLIEEIFYLKKKNMSNEEIKSYLLIKYGQELCEKVFEEDLKNM